MYQLFQQETSYVQEDSVGYSLAHPPLSHKAFSLFLEPWSLFLPPGFCAYKSCYPRHFLSTLTK